MNKAASLIVLLVNSGLACASAYSAELPVEEIFKKVSETYRSLQAYQFAAVRSFQVSVPGFGEQSLSEEELGLAEVKPGKFRLTVKGAKREIVLVSNGETTWTYLPKEKQFTQESVAASPEEAESEAEGEEQDVLTGTRNLLVARYAGLVRYSSLASLGRDDRIKIGGRKVECYRAKFESNARTHELWIDKERFLVLRHKETNQSRHGGITATLDVTLNLKAAELIAPPGAYFDFAPPDKAKQVQALNLPGERVNLTGKGAADFTLKDLRGEEVSLSDFRGKIVLLDFWATWCGPCRKELPSIEKLDRELKEKGVVILGVNDEDTGTVKSFLKKNQSSLTTLVDSKGAVHKMYGARAIPTVVVIDRRGVVVAYLVGTRGENELRAALRAAGLEEGQQGSTP